jgi:hypothetical protein
MNRRAGKASMLLERNSYNVTKIIEETLNQKSEYRNSKQIRRGSPRLTKIQNSKLVGAFGL